MQIPIIKQLEEEIKKLERELRIDLPKGLQEAAAHGDLSENAEYKAARERQSYLQARIAHLRIRINSLSSINLNSLPRDRVAFGAKIFLEDLATGDKVVYEKALLNKKIGDVVRINLPTGVKEYEVTDIVTLHEMLKG